MQKVIFIAVVIIGSLAQAQSARQEADQLRQRVADLESTVRGLQEKVQKMEGTLMKGGGFMIVANYTCEIKTPFNGSYAATELSEIAARNSVMEQCKAKSTDKNQCIEMFVKCGK